jgi:rhodanese-related sulfurtransferase
MNTWHITPQQVRARVARREALHFLDLRSDADRSRSGAQLPGAIRPGAPVVHGAAVVLYGQHGWEAGIHEAAARLRAQGHGDVRILAGGFSAWTELGLPVEPRA